MTSPNKILIFGATSAIAYETTKIFAKDGVSFYLCGRNKTALISLGEDLRVRGAKKVEYSTFDALNTTSIIEAIDKSLETFPDLDGVIIAHGLLPDQKLCETDIDKMKQAMEINFTSAATILTYILPHFEKQGRGTIAVITSIAGDRGRQSNYIYGSAKSALSTFLSGLRQRVDKLGVKIITIKPGFVDTPMTVGFKKNFLFVGPEVIAKGIYRAIHKGDDVVYLPSYWWCIIGIIKMIPERIFKKISL